MKTKIYILSGLLLLSMLLSGTIAASAAMIDPNRYGDADGDGKITTTDARLVLQSCVGKGSVSKTVADVDWDGEITTTDARLILQAAAGKKNYSCVGLRQEFVYPVEGGYYQKEPEMSWDIIRGE